MCDLWLKAIITPTETLVRVNAGALENYGRLTGKTWGCLEALPDPDVRSLTPLVTRHGPGRDCL